MSAPLGLEPGVVRLVEYDERWPGLFATEAGCIRVACRSLSLALEHVGSTAVPGLCAKPVLDILAGHPSSISAASYVQSFQEAGYVHRGDRGIPGHQFFRRGQPRAYHIHLVEEGGTLWRQYLAFRDRLRSDAGAAQRYGDLKRQLARAYPRDRDSYINGKADFILGACTAGN